MSSSISTTIMTDDGVRLACRLDGPADAPPLLFINSLGLDYRMWEPQVAALAGPFRTVRYDARGHGQSDVPPAPYSLERLGRDALAVLDACGVERAHVCGLSLGGITALWLAIHRPARLNRAVFANTAGCIGTPEAWDSGSAAIRNGGMAAIQEGVLGLFLSAGFRARDPATTERIRSMVTALTAEACIGCFAALRDADLRHLLSTIAAPSLVIGSELDESTPPALAEDVHAAIVPSTLMVIPGAAHLSNIEAPDLFNRRVLEHLTTGSGGAR